MAITVAMYSPNGLLGQTFTCKSGNSYTPGSNGVVTGVSPQDVNDLESDGLRILEQAGSGTGNMSPAGNLYAATYGQTALNPTATGGDYVVAVYAIPANTFDGLGVAGPRGLQVTGAGSFAANTNNSRVKLYFNPTAATVGATVAGGNLIADLGTTSQSGAGWSIAANVFKLGATGSNTQMAQATGLIAGTSHLGVNAPVFPTAVESSGILVALTANCATAKTDVNVNLFEVTFMD